MANDTDDKPIYLKWMGIVEILYFLDETKICLPPQTHLRAFICYVLFYAFFSMLLYFYASILCISMLMFEGVVLAVSRGTTLSLCLFGTLIMDWAPNDGKKVIKSEDNFYFIMILMVPWALFNLWAPPPQLIWKKLHLWQWLVRKCIQQLCAQTQGSCWVLVWLASHVLPYLSPWVGCRL